MAPRNFVETTAFEPFFQETIDDLIQTAHVLHSSLREHMSGPWKNHALKIQILDDDCLNAETIRTIGFDCIIINRGMLEGIYGTMWGIMSCPSFLPMIGDTSVEVEPTNDLSGGFPALPLLRVKYEKNERIGTLIPNDPGRLLVANVLAYIATEFLVFHEIGHVIGGHLELLAAQNRKTSISEFQSSTLLGNKSRLRQALETDADAFARDVTSFVSLQQRIDEVIPEIACPPSWDSSDLSLVVYAASTGVLFRMLFVDAPPQIKSDGLDYPHPSVRACVVSSWTLANAWQKGIVSPETFPDLLQDSVQNVESEWAKYALPGQIPDSGDIWSRQLREASSDLLAVFQDARPLLSMHARVPRRWDDLSPSAAEPKA